MTSKLLPLALSQLLLSGVAITSLNGQEFESSYNERFLKTHPLLGTEVKDTELYAADGTPFKLSSARGKYTVVVFGCLT